MPYRSAVIVAVLLAALAPANGEATTRMSFSIAKSFHPESDRNYSTVHPGFGATGRLAGEWLRWRAGSVRHSHSRLGPYAGVAATWQVLGNWRLGLSAGLVGNYPRGRWVRRGVVPIAQWKDRDRNLVWEFGFARAERVTFVGLSVQIPFSGLAAMTGGSNSSSAFPCRCRPTATSRNHRPALRGEQALLAPWRSNARNRRPTRPALGSLSIRDLRP